MIFNLIMFFLCAFDNQWISRIRRPVDLVSENVFEQLFAKLKNIWNYEKNLK